MRAEDAARAALDRAIGGGVTDAVVTVSRVRETMVRFSDNQVTVVNELDLEQGSVFVTIGARKAAVDIPDLRARSIRAAVDAALSLARSASEGDARVPLPSGPFDYDPLLLDQGKVDGLDAVDLAHVAISSALEEGASRVAGSMTVRDADTILLTSGGVDARVRKPFLEMSVRAFAATDASGHGLSVSGSPAVLDPAGAGARAGRLASLSMEPIHVDAGEYDVVLDTMAFADVASQLGRMASAFMVDAGMSFLGDKLGQQVASDMVTIMDDPTLVGTPGSTPCDMEGLPSRRNVIVDDGVLHTLLHNSTTAARHGTESTANAGLVAPHPFNLVIGNGDQDMDSLLSQVDRGIYITNDWYLRYQNYATGDFSAIPRDAMFLVEDGAITCPVKEMRMSDNILGMLQRVEGLTREREWVRWWEVDTPTLTPAALVRGLHMSRSTM